MFLRKSEESQHSLFVTVCEYHLQGSTIPSPGPGLCVCVLRVNMCDYVLQVPCSHFGDESEQPNEYFGLKIFFSLLLLLLMSSAILSDLNTLEAPMMNTFFVLRMPL